MKSKQMFFVAFAVCVFLVPAVALAQGGCVDSPENPTALLAVVGGLGGAFSLLRSKFRK